MFYLDELQLVLLLFNTQFIFFKVLFLLFCDVLGRLFKPLEENSKVSDYPALPRERTWNESHEQLMWSDDCSHEFLRVNQGGLSTANEYIHVDNSQVLQLRLVHLSNEYFVTLLVGSFENVFDFIDQFKVLVDNNSAHYNTKDLRFILLHFLNILISLHESAIHFLRLNLR